MRVRVTTALWVEVLAGIGCSLTWGSQRQNNGIIYGSQKDQLQRCGPSVGHLTRVWPQSPLETGGGLIGRGK